VATIAFCGPSDELASKVAVGLVPVEGAAADPIERWFSEDRDVRKDPTIGEEILSFIHKHGAKTVVMSDRIIGCPHEEGTDYPQVEVCPQFPVWTHRDRWSGEIVHWRGRWHAAQQGAAADRATPRFNRTVVQFWHRNPALRASRGGGPGS
jgi:hypothetical protein